MTMMMIMLRFLLLLLLVLLLLLAFIFGVVLYVPQEEGVHLLLHQQYDFRAAKEVVTWLQCRPATAI
jgi:hypothetical protein